MSQSTTHNNDNSDNDNNNYCLQNEEYNGTMVKYTYMNSATCVEVHGHTDHLYYNSPYICLSVLANSRSRVRVSVRPSNFFYKRKTPKTISNTASHARLFILMKHRPVIHRQRNMRKGGVNFVIVGRRLTNRTATTWTAIAVGGCMRVRECVRVYVRVSVYACVCVRACVRACTMCLP